MKVKDLIKLLETLDKDLEIKVCSEMIYSNIEEVHLYPKQYLREWQEEFYYIE